MLAFGNPGSGKTHLLSAIGYELVYQGHKVLFVACSLLVQELLAAKKELRLARALKKFGKFDALVIDDIGYVQHDREEMEVLFTLLADRYERTSIMLTSNLDVKAILADRLRELHLPAFRECFSEEADRARKASSSYERYLLELADREAEARRQNRIERLLRQSKLPPSKTFETFDMARLPRSPPR